MALRREVVGERRRHHWQRGQQKNELLDGMRATGGCPWPSWSGATGSYLGSQRVWVPTTTTHGSSLLVGPVGAAQAEATAESMTRAMKESLRRMEKPLGGV